MSGKIEDWGPYEHLFERVVSAEKDQLIEFRLKRKPGVLFKVAIPKDIPRSSSEAEDWESVSVSIRYGGKSGSAGVSDRRPYGFWQVENWGDEVGLLVELLDSDPRRPGGQRRTELLKETYTADPDSWPIEIDAVKLREVTPRGG